MTGVTYVRAAAAVFLLTLPGNLAFAQIDLNGTWDNRVHEDWMERVDGPIPVDYLGLALNDEGRAKALEYTTATLSMIERQCLQYGPHYVVFGPQGLRIWSEADPVTGRTVAWKISGAGDRDIVTIWMDGRRHPSRNAFHPFSGFTTGEWEGDTLTTYTTHLKEGYLRRNGVPLSDQATVVQHITRHGDRLTITAIIEDPVYLDAPSVVSRTWQLDPRVIISPTGSLCFAMSELPRLDETGTVPHYLPGENPFVNEMTKVYHIPLEAVLGHAETRLPEYRKIMKDTYVAPAKCERFCCGWVVAGPGAPQAAPGLSCFVGGSGKLSIPPQTSSTPPAATGSRASSQ